jgi:uncharacterized protein with NAD-binding domain and iron-sulfur cluster
MRVAIAGASPARLACAKYLVDAGCTPIVFGSIDKLGGLVAVLKNKDGDCYPTGLHIFGTYPDILQLFQEIGIENPLRWKEYSMLFKQPKMPITYSRFDFPDITASFHGVPAILQNKETLMRGLNGTVEYLENTDLYFSVMPVDALKIRFPSSWKEIEFFLHLDGLEGVPVINLHLWFDRKLTDIDHLLFSHWPLLSIYADMSNTCNGYANPHHSILELVFSPFSDWISKWKEKILQATLGELKKLFLNYFGGENSAKLLEYYLVKTPRSVYKATPGCQQYPPSQETSTSNFYLAGSHTIKGYLGSMVSAVLSGKLTAQAIAPAHPEENSSSLQTPNIQPATNAATA